MAIKATKQLLTPTSLPSFLPTALLQAIIQSPVQDVRQAVWAAFALALVLALASYLGPAQLFVACMQFPYCKRRKGGWGLGTRKKTNKQKKQSPVATTSFDTLPSPPDYYTASCKCMAGRQVFRLKKFAVISNMHITILIRK